MDNHEAHLSYEVIRLAKNSEVILLTVPPYTSHKLQPLGKCVYGPLKRYYNELLGVAYPLAFTQKNCISIFKSTETVLPYPKVGIAVNVAKRGGREKKQAGVLTSTPVMNKLKQEYMEKTRKKERRIMKGAV
ncbi:hypothetical protein ILUMI_03531 [Ignelater luminosus]|uniref:DDE-1 domain-containing protein n=1 Tax=Ignelater luminosus TaxID=2038154 RepID=A0A8K0DG61_IGNLU|nr:hypothetical protein ILUMI_03531 [Ignelater luminosus]